MGLQDGLKFGFGAMALYGEDNIFRSDIVGSFTGAVKGDLAPTMGGASGFPIAAREKRASGEISLTLRENPTALEQAINNGTITEAKAFDGTVRNVKGTSVSTLTFTAKAGETALGGYYDIMATGNDAISVQYINENGRSNAAIAVSTIS